MTTFTHFLFINFFRGNILKDHFKERRTDNIYNYKFCYIDNYYLICLYISEIGFVKCPDILGAAFLRVD